LSEGVPPPDDGQPLDDSQLGEPIAELSALEETPAAGFADRIRGGILRRIAGVHFLEFDGSPACTSWSSRSRASWSSCGRSVT
jgi:hypothetical protein